MPTLVVTGASPDAWIASNGSATYATVRAGAATLAVAGDPSDLFVGQSNNAGPTFYQVNEILVQFDTSAIPDAAAIKSAVLSMYGTNDASAQDFTIYVSAHDFGAGAIATADYVPGATLAELPILASFPTASLALAAYNVFTSIGDLFARAINKAGNTRLILYSSRTRDALAPAPGTLEYVSFAEEGAGGTTTDPKLTIVYSVDMVVEVSLSNLNGDTDEECGVSFRLSDTSNFLAAYVDDGDNLVHLSKFVAGVETSIATATWTPADSAEIRVICQGDRIRVWVDRKLVIDATDSTHDGNERAGLFSRSTTVVLFENFYVEAL